MFDISFQAQLYEKKHVLSLFVMSYYIAILHNSGPTVISLWPLCQKPLITSSSARQISDSGDGQSALRAVSNCL